ncbi:hypothetical protein J6590_017974 [Homalodisca vitripennis]|nr:hypothetical protein J6590_017974 [Homalodisca vitripennis]
MKAQLDIERLTPGDILAVNDDWTETTHRMSKLKVIQLQAGGRRYMPSMPAQRRKRGACILSLPTFFSRGMGDPAAIPLPGPRQHHWGDAGK